MKKFSEALLKLILTLITLSVFSFAALGVYIAVLGNPTIFNGTGKICLILWAFSFCFTFPVIFIKIWKK